MKTPGPFQKPTSSLVGLSAHVEKHWAKQHYYIRSRRKPISILELQLNLQKHIKTCCNNFNKMSITRKNSAAREF